jgi:hypothetical protein
MRGSAGVSLAPVLVVWVVFLTATLALAQTPVPRTVLAQSQSGQFCIRADASPPLAPRFVNLETNQNLARLEPTILPTSCERIKQMLWRVLGAKPPWRGRVLLVLRPAISGDDPVTIIAERFVDRWQYTLQLPELVERTRYVRSVVNVLLLEMANRNAGARSAEVPPWLVEGLTQELLASSSRDQLIPPPPKPNADIMRPSATFTYVDARRPNPLEAAHQSLKQTTPLTFQELSWPVSDEMDLTTTDLYQHTAQLFVDELLAFPDGAGCLRAMLFALPEHYNWQFAFLRAFQAYFQRPLDVEKWWALQVVHFTGRELAQTWPAGHSWQKLDELVRSEVQIRFGTNQLPQRAEVSLQTVIAEWEPAHQLQAIQTKLQELDMLRPRVVEALLPLVDEYRQVLGKYVQELNHVGAGLASAKKPIPLHAIDEAIRQLNVLDLKRASLRPSPQLSTQASGKLEGPSRDGGPSFPNQARSEH